MNLRQQQADTTRQAIIDAFLTLVHEENAVTVSVPAVARRAGVSVRTLYRYFANKDELQNAAAMAPAERARARGQLDDVGPANLVAYVEALWSSFAEDIPAVAAEHHTPVGRQMRAARLGISRAQVSQGVPELNPARVDLVVAVLSSSMFLELVDRMGHDPIRAARMATWLVGLIRSAPGTEPCLTEEKNPA